MCVVLVRSLIVVINYIYSFLRFAFLASRDTIRGGLWITCHRSVVVRLRSGVRVSASLHIFALITSRHVTCREVIKGVILNTAKDHKGPQRTAKELRNTAKDRKGPQKHRKRTAKELRNTTGHRRLCKHRQCSPRNVNSQINTVALLMLSKYYAVCLNYAHLSKCSWS